MKNKLCGLVAVLIAGIAIGQYTKVEKTVGEFRVAGMGSMTFSVIDYGTRRVGQIHVCDEDVLRSVLFLINTNELDELGRLLVKFDREMHKPATKP